MQSRFTFGETVRHGSARAVIIAASIALCPWDISQQGAFPAGVRAPEAEASGLQFELLAIWLHIAEPLVARHLHVMDVYSCHHHVPQEPPEDCSADRYGRGIGSTPANWPGNPGHRLCPYATTLVKPLAPFSTKY